MSAEDAPAASEAVLPIAVTIYQQPGVGPRLRLPTGRLARPGEYFLLAQFERGGELFYHSGPYPGFVALQEAMKTTWVRPIENDS